MDVSATCRQDLGRSLCRFHAFSSRFTRAHTWWWNDCGWSPAVCLTGMCQSSHPEAPRHAVFFSHIVWGRGAGTGWVSTSCRRQRRLGRSGWVSVGTRTLSRRPCRPSSSRGGPFDLRAGDQPLASRAGFRPGVLGFLGLHSHSRDALVPNVATSLRQAARRVEWSRDRNLAATAAGSW